MSPERTETLQSAAEAQGREEQDSVLLFIWAGAPSDPYLLGRQVQVSKPSGCDCPGP